MTAETILAPTDLARVPNLAAALCEVQANLPKLERDRRVEVEKKTGGTYEYSYVTLANLNDEVLPLLASNGLSFVGLPGIGSDGKMCLRYLLLHKSGESLGGEFPISGEGGIQMIGGRITYARRYCLAAVVGVAADEDDDARLDETSRGTAQRAAPRGRQSAQAKPAARDDRPTAQRGQRSTEGPPLPDEGDGMTRAQQGKMQALFKQVDMTDRADRMRYVNEVLAEKIGPERRVASSNELTKVEAGHVIDKLQKFADQAEPNGGDQ